MSKKHSNAQHKPVAETVTPAVEAPKVETPKVEIVQGAETVTPIVEGFTAESVMTKTAPELITAYGNKSNAIRGLNGLGLKTGPISKLLGIRYQHARNVLSKPLKRVIKETRDAKNEHGAAVASEGNTATA